ncbi:SMP-30/gluconolactonase/LRE family protein [Chachezhania sediminis]|uniref:SMP-30/gluconolactonase/LRE family protein n=1 Tax=Chachezhania sediminis TaxID=2599291 RepID=UPI00131DF64A|nr:SMP-30/gluconolactonase/LRE family protein [Chachezhania sediminis]
MDYAALTFTPCCETETLLGEGPVWDDRRNLLWLVDILAPALLSWCPATARLDRYEMPDLITSVSLTGDDRLLISLRKSVCFFDPTTGVLDTLVTPEPNRPMNRLNDGKIGPDGALWIGSMHATRPAQPTAALYRVTPDGGCRLMIDDVHVSNGLAWSPDHKVMYHADSRAPSVTAWAFDSLTGDIGNPQPFAAPTEAEGLPDGAAVDTDGNYWIAGVTGGCVHVYAPDGRLLDRIPAGMDAPTMPCFGGADGQTLFLTGLTRDAGGKRSEGRLMSAHVPVRGVPVARFGQPLVGGIVQAADGPIAG